VNAPPALSSARIRPRSSCSGPPPVGPGPPPARSSLILESSEQLPSIAPRWPQSESLGFECATTWLAVRRRAPLRSSLSEVDCRADGCLPSGGRARSESVCASCTLVGWALSIGLIDLPCSHWTYVTFKQQQGPRAVRGQRRSCTALYEAALPVVRRAPKRDHRPRVGSGSYALTHALFGRKVCSTYSRPPVWSAD
jgi:hypothetical protein